MSRELRRTIREMVQEGKSNQQIYRHVQNEYGPDQIAVPHQGYMNRVSYGLPYVAMGLMILTAYWLGWNWWVKRRRDDDEPLSDDERESLDQLSDSIDSPLQ